MRASQTTHPSSSAHPKSPSKKAQYLYRTHKIALAPTPTQEGLLAKHADYARAAYNWALRFYKDRKAAGQEPTQDTLQRTWRVIRTSRYPWGSKLSQPAATHAIKALEHGIKVWKDKKRSNLDPRFHSRTRKNAFRVGDEIRTVSCTDKRIDLPNIGSVRMLEALRLEGRIHMVTVKREVGRWFACVTVEMRSRIRRRPGVVGVDVGIRRMATCSDGTAYQKYAGSSVGKGRQTRQEDKIRRYTKQLDHQTLGSNRRQRMMLKLERARYRVRCRRDDAQRKAAADIVRKGGRVGVETLDVRGMMKKNKGMAKELSRAAMGGMRRHIVQGCEAAGVEVVEAGAFFPSTRRCSQCGELQDMPLDKDVYKCQRCGLVIDRDDNAARNLRRNAEEMP